MIEMPQAGPQGVPQQMEAQQGPPQEQPQTSHGKGQPYPSGPEEAYHFANNIMEEIYRDGAEGQNIKAITNMPPGMEAEKGVGMLAGKIVGQMVNQLRGAGRKPSIKMAMGAIGKTVDELIEIGSAAGIEGMNPDISQPAIAIASNLIDQQNKQGGQGGQAQAGQPGQAQQPQRGNTPPPGGGVQLPQAQTARKHGGI